MSDDVEIPIRDAPLAVGARPGVLRQQATVAPPPPAAAPLPSTAPPGGNGGGSGSGGPGGSGSSGDDDQRPRLRKLRLLAILIGLGALALVSTVFGMMMAVASDIPQIENVTRYTPTRNSYLYDDQGRPIGIFSAPDPEVIDTWKGRTGVSPWMLDAIVAVEDKRYWSDPGIDMRGIARAFLSDLTGGATQGASTITEQFVKNALSEQDNRTILEKLREAGLAFQLTHRWSKRQILLAYLNSSYFGEGAYGVESAARVYFGSQLGYDPNAATDGNTTACGDSTPQVRIQSCASRLDYWQAALIAGLVASPSAFDPVANLQAALARRDLVLQDMLQQHDINRAQYEIGIHKPLPTATDNQTTAEPSAAPYFVSWLRPQILSAMGLGRPGVPAKVAEYRAYYGGLKIKTTLDLRLQEAADQVIEEDLPYGSGEPTASLVAIDNKTGQVRAMVGGPIVNGQEDYSQYPFNLATAAERQPGSAFKPFTLAVALEHGFGPDSVFLSAPLDIVVPNSGGKEIFRVRNFGDEYSGDITLQEATDSSDNSVFERLGWYGLGGTRGTTEIRNMARNAGIQTPVSTNPAMILGGLKVGVSPLEMAHAYETFATGGNRVYDKVLGSPGEGPTGIERIECPRVCPTKRLVDHPVDKRVLPPAIAADVHNMLLGVVSSGTGTAAAIPGVDVAGKTGTTTNYADAWFVGWTPQLTVAVWVGFPKGAIPMETLYNGGPVEGGTFPAVIWRDFMVQALQILASEQPASHQTSTTPTTSVGSSSAPSTGAGGSAAAPATTSAPTTPTTTTPANANPGNGGGTGNGGAGNAGTGANGTGTGANGNGTGAGTGAGGGTGGGGGTAGGGGTGGGGGGTGSGSGSGSGSGGAGVGGGGAG